MPTPTPSSAPASISPFLERLVRFLIPFFLPITSDLALVRAEILETLASYGARTRADMLNAVRIIAFSMSALDMLAEAKANEEMSHAMRLRYRACANGLNRASQQNEKILAARIACDQPGAAASAPDPAGDIPDTAIEASLRQVRSKIEAYRNRLSPTPAAHTQPTGRSAMFNALLAPGHTPAPS